MSVCDNTRKCTMLCVYTNLYVKGQQLCQNLLQAVTSLLLLPQIFPTDQMCWLLIHREGVLRIRSSTEPTLPCIFCKGGWPLNDKCDRYVSLSERKLSRNVALDV